VQRFGAAILKEDGTMDRQKMGQMVFNDAQKRKELELIIHPLIHELLNKELKNKGLVEKPRFWFYEASLIFETGTAGKFRQVWVTYCSEKAQLKRLQTRNNYSPEMAKKIIASQMPGKQKAALGDFVINTESPIEELSEKVKSALSTLDAEL
jgi:dephospho-CoA kinase